MYKITVLLVLSQTSVKLSKVPLPSIIHRHKFLGNTTQIHIVQPLFVAVCQCNIVKPLLFSWAFGRTHLDPRYIYDSRWSRKQTCSTCTCFPEPAQDFFHHDSSSCAIPGPIKFSRSGEQHTIPRGKLYYARSTVLACTA